MISVLSAFHFTPPPHYFGVQVASWVQAVQPRSANLIFEISCLISVGVEARQEGRSVKLLG